MLCAVFLTGGWRLAPLFSGGEWYSSSSSESKPVLFRFRPLHCSGSGDEAEDGEEGYFFIEGIAWAMSWDF